MVAKKPTKPEETEPTETEPTETERKYDPGEIADELLLRTKTVWNLFVNEPGVLRFNHPKHKRQPWILRIPESVKQRVLGRLTVQERE